MTLSEIIERLEKAECGDRKLDLTIMNLLAPRAEDEKHLVMGKLLGAKWGAYGHMANQIEYFIEAPKITSSVDAAIALAEKALPKWSISLGLSEWYKFPVVTMGRSYPTNKSVAVEHHTAPLALCLAILKAKQMGVGE